MDAPRAVKARQVASISWEGKIPWIWVIPAATPAQSKARWAMLLEGGTVTQPWRRLGWMRASILQIPADHLGDGAAFWMMEAKRSGRTL